MGPGADAAGVRPDRRRQRLDATGRRRSPRRSARASSASRGAGSAPPATPGCSPRAADVVCFMDCDASLDPRELVDVVAPVLRGDADLVLGARRAVERGAWPPHARVANARARAPGAPPRRRRADRPRPDARRAPDHVDGLGLEDRRFGWPLEMVVRAAAAGWRIEERPVAYRPRVGRSKVTGTCAEPRARCATCGGGAGVSVRGAGRPRQGAAAGPGQDAAVPAVHAGRGRRARRRRAARHAARGGRDARRDAAGLRARRRAGPVAARRRRGPAQRGAGLDERLAAAFADVAEPALLVGMDTPQVTPALLRRRARARWRAPTPSSGPRPTAATGRSACARPTTRSSTASR